MFGINAGDGRDHAGRLRVWDIWGHGPGHHPHDEDPGQQGELDDVSCPHRSLLLSTLRRCGATASPVWYQGLSAHYTTETARRQGHPTGGHSPSARTWGSGAQASTRLVRVAAS